MSTGTSRRSSKPGWNDRSASSRSTGSAARRQRARRHPRCGRRTLSSRRVCSTWVRLGERPVPHHLERSERSVLALGPPPPDHGDTTSATPSSTQAAGGEPDQSFVRRVGEVVGEHGDEHGRQSRMPAADHPATAGPSPERGDVRRGVRPDWRREHAAVGGGPARSSWSAACTGCRSGSSRTGSPRTAGGSCATSSRSPAVARPEGRAEGDPGDGPGGRRDCACRSGG